MSRKFYCSECGVLLTLTRMAIPKKAVILDLIEPHVCGEKVNLESKFTNNECLEYIPKVGKSSQSVQISNDLDAMLADRRSKEHVKDFEAPMNILDKIFSQLKGGS